MAFDYAGLRDGSVYNIIVEFGASLSHIQETPGQGYQAATGTFATPATTTTTAFVGVVTDYDTREIDGTRIRVSDKKVFAEAKSFNDASITPRPGDLIDGIGSIADDGIKPISPAGTTVAYEFQVRTV